MLMLLMPADADAADADADAAGGTWFRRTASVRARLSDVGRGGSA